MKYSNALYISIGERSVENYMTADGKLSIPDLGYIASYSRFERIGWHMENIVKLLGVNAALFFTPSVPGVRCNRFKVNFSCFGKRKCSH